MELRNLSIEANLLSRLERMPMNKTLAGIVAMLTWCWVVEAFDIGLIGQVVAVLKQIWNLTPNETGLLATSSTTGVVIGVIFAGALTDRFGRRKVLLWGTFIFTFFTLVGAFYGNLAWIVLMRFLSGLGGGAVFPQPYLMISEIAPAKYRGILVGISNGILTLAYLFPTLCGSWAVGTFPLEDAWRVPFIVGGIPILTIYFIYRLVPESPRWLMLHGRYDEARSLVERMEKSCCMPHDDKFVDEQMASLIQNTRKKESENSEFSWKMLFKPPLLSRSLGTWGIFSVGLVTFYTIMVYLPTIATQQYGVSLATSVQLSGWLLVVGGFGSFIFGALSDKIGRKLTYTIFLGLTACLIFLFPGLTENTGRLLVVAALTFFAIGANSVARLYIAEQYPTALRGVGAGFGEAFSRVMGGVFATYYVAFFLSIGA